MPHATQSKKKTIAMLMELAWENGQMSEATMTLDQQLPKCWPEERVKGHADLPLPVDGGVSSGVC